MKELRRKLGERYWRMDEYFNESWEIFKKLIKSKWGAVFIFFSLFNSLSILKIPMLDVVSGISSIIVGFMLIFVLKRIMEMIEEKKIISKIEMFGRILLSGIIFGLIIFAVVLGILWTPITEYILLKETRNIFGSAIMLVLGWILFICIINIMYFLYFSNIYFTRKIDFMDAIKYSIHISKGNRLRILIPILIIQIISIILRGVPAGIFLSLSFLSSLQYTTYITLALVTIVDIITYLLTIYSTVLGVIIYLNVEYMDLGRKEDEILEEQHIVSVLDSEVVIAEDEESVKVIAENNKEKIQEENFRKAEEKDIPKMVEMIEMAKIRIAGLNIDQWQDGYPNEEVLRKDIENETSYVLVDNGVPVATGALIFGIEDAYENLAEGYWITNEKNYGTLHRLAVDNNGLKKGYATKLMNKMIEECKNKGIKSLRTDTHENNGPMKAYLYKNGFTYCGVCYYTDKGEPMKRIVFEKELR